ncbi:MAG: winged helix-turn-helix domain-containing protein [Anaerolineales bacterium]
MSDPNAYPSNYRVKEITQVVNATRAGECVAVIGLSGAGKSNVMRFLAQTPPPSSHTLVLADWNRLAAPTASALFDLLRRTLGDTRETDDPLTALETTLAEKLAPRDATLSLLFDRSDALAATAVSSPQVFGNLRALRDAHKYQLTYVIASRRPLDARNELAELFFGNTLWLGPLSESDARWTITRYTTRKGLNWNEKTTRTLIELTRGYPSFLRAACEAHAVGCALTVEALAAHPALHARLAEFWADAPTDEELRLCGLNGLALLLAAKPGPKIEAPAFDTSRLTAKENSLLQFFLQHPNTVCEKDDVIRAVWAEDKVFAQGVRDDSLAQLIRRLREKIEPDPANPRYIHTVPGRGYRFTLGS